SSFASFSFTDPSFSNVLSTFSGDVPAPVSFFSGSGLNFISKICSSLHARSAASHTTRRQHGAPFSSARHKAASPTFFYISLRPLPYHSSHCPARLFYACTEIGNSIDWKCSETTKR